MKWKWPRSGTENEEEWTPGWAESAFLEMRERTEGGDKYLWASSSAL